MPLKTTFKIPAELCIKCRSTKLLCGLTYCPISISEHLEIKSRTIPRDGIAGASPPSVFVGRYGYPKIQLYPSTPAESGDTSLYESPSQWLSMDMEKFLEMRLSLLRGGKLVSVSDAASPGYFLQDVQIMTLSSAPVEVEMKLEGSLRGSRYLLSEYTPPMGPSAPLQSMKIGTAKPDAQAEKIYYDTDLKAAEGMYSLYRSSIDVSRISRILSVGSLGVGKGRKLVPTRWSITAADKTLSDFNVKNLKRYPSVDDFHVFVRTVSGNLFMGIVGPGSWRYEWGEAWFPGSTWNSFGDRVQVMIDHEDFAGRKTYPDIGGCYYSSRLAVSEYLDSIRRSGVALLWREIYPNFNIPLGVWYVRENMREMFRGRPLHFDSLESATSYLQRFTKVPIGLWKAKSWVTSSMKNPTLDRFF